jgi:uncharacterized protein YuzE
MAIDYREYLNLISLVEKSPQHEVSMSYDREADVFYVNFNGRQVATDSEYLDNGVIVRYHDDTIIGFTITHASNYQPT